MTRELLPIATSAQTRAAVRVLLRPHRGTAVGALVLLTASTAAGLLTAPLLGRIVDLVAEGRPADALTLPVAGIMISAIVQGVLSGFGVSLVSRLGESLLAGLRERFVERALRLPLERVERAGSGDLTSRVTNDVAVVAEGVRNALPQLARSALTIGLTLVGLLALDWRLMLAALVAVPIQLHTVRWYVRRAVPLYAGQRVIAGAQQQQQLGAVGGAATVRAFGLAAEHLDRVARSSRAVVEIALRGIRLVTRFYARLNLAEFCGLAAVLATGFLLVRSGSVSIGTATAAALYFHGLFTPINIALGLADDAQSSLAALARLVGVAELAGTNPMERSGKGSEPAGVRVRGAGHAYVAGHEVLREVDLDLAAGERVALVGASGAGKTTLAKLVSGLHTPSSGSIEVPGRVALITQEVHVFAGTLAEDLRLARPDADEQDLLEALGRVGALEWAKALPEGLATVVGDGGHRLTAAQAQQLALARLVLADPPVVVLDEATAEAGSAGARMLESAARNAITGRTALVVAHRLTQAAAADRIVVMEEGRIVETGTHDELIRRSGGRYAALWEAWSGSRRT